MTKVEVVIPREKYTVAQHSQHFVESNGHDKRQAVRSISMMRAHSRRPSSIRFASHYWCSTEDLRVVTASRSFYLTFRVNRQETQGQLLYSLGDGQWDIPALRALLEKIVPEHAVLNDYQVEHEFPHIGRRVMLLNASKVFYDDDAHTTVLLAIEDITRTQGR